MSRKFYQTLIKRVLHIMFLAVNLFFLFCYYKAMLEYAGTQNFYSHLKVNWIVAIGYVIALYLLARVYHGFLVGSARISEVFFSLGLAVVIADAGAYVLFTIYMAKFLNPLYLLILIAIQSIWNLAWAYFANRIYFMTHAPRAAAVISRAADAVDKLNKITYFDFRFCIVKHIVNPAGMENIEDCLNGCEVVFLIGIDMELRNAIVKQCIDRGIRTYIKPKLGDIVMSGAEHMQMFSEPIMRVDRANPSPEYRLAKRMFDIFASLCAIILTFPVMLGVAIAIKVYDRGPVFYKQIRLTKNRKEFEILKFRSMREDAEKDGVARLAAEHDDRITPVGHFIRACRLDELPQLFNILKGDMTLVGPRPERPEIAAEYEKEMPTFALRLQVKAGLTGYAQIYGRYNTEPYEKLQMDLMYINKMSITQDLWLMFATVKVLFIKESTKGVKEGWGTAVKTGAADP